MPGIEQQLREMFAELGKLGPFRNPLEELLRKEGLTTDEYLRYWRLRPEERKRLEGEGVEWVKRCQEFDERAKARLHAAAERRRAEFQEVFGELGEEVHNLLGERFRHARTYVDFGRFDEEPDTATTASDADSAVEDLWAEAVDQSGLEGELPDEDDAYRGTPESGEEATVKPGKAEKLVEALEKLAALKDAGHIDEAEFKKAKKKLLK